MKIESRITVGKCIHQGKELDCYLPEVCIDGVWKSCLTPGDYILKDSYNPLTTCGKCGGNGMHCYLNDRTELVWDAQKKCKKCNGIGLQKGTVVDNIGIAEWYVKKAIEEIELLEKLRKKYGI